MTAVGGRVGPSKRAVEQFEEGATRSPKGRGQGSGRFRDTAKDDGGVPFEDGPSILSGLIEDQPKSGGQAFGRRRGGTMLVDHAARGRFERGGEGGCRLDDVRVDERLELRRLITPQERADQDEQLGLPVAEVPHGLEEPADVVLLLTDDRSRRMLPGGCEVAAIARTGDFGQAFGAATDGTDMVAKGRARASCLTLAAEGAEHGGPFYPGREHEQSCRVRGWLVTKVVASWSGR